MYGSNFGSKFGKCMGQFSFSQRHIPTKNNLEYRTKTSIAVLHQLFKNESQFHVFESQIAMRYEKIPGLCVCLCACPMYVFVSFCFCFFSLVLFLSCLVVTVFCYVFVLSRFVYLCILLLLAKRNVTD